MICCIPPKAGPSPALSICIPTWNRSGKLQSQLRGLIAHLTDVMEIVVVDNGSDDDTLGAVRAIAAEHPDARLSLWANEVNLGADVNYLRALELGTGEWLWLLGDDEFINPSKLPLLLYTLNSCDDDLAFVRLERFRIPTGDLKVLREDFLARRFDDLGYWVHKIGLVAVRRSAAMQAYKRGYSAGIGTLHAHSIVVLVLIDAGHGVRVIDVPGLFIQHGLDIVEPPRWNALAGVMGAWQASEIGLSSASGLAKRREQRVRGRELVSTLVHRLATDEGVSSADMRTPTRLVPWPGKAVLLAIRAAAKLPPVARRHLVGLALKAKGSSNGPSSATVDY